MSKLSNLLYGNEIIPSTILTKKKMQMCIRQWDIRKCVMDGKPLTARNTENIAANLYPELDSNPVSERATAMWVLAYSVTHEVHK
jgi:hypothetical protein